MTLEGQGEPHGETPAPPARTRWSEGEGDEEDVLLPPYTPGRARTGAEQSRRAAPPPAPSSPAPARAEKPLPPDDGDPDPADPWAAAPDLTEDGQETVASTVEPEPQGSVEETPYDAALPEDDFPFDAFDLGGGDEGLVDAAIEVEEQPVGFRGPGAGSPEVAERLERLADALRREGRGALEREVRSPDRLTSLLAGVLAGYLAGSAD